MQFNKSRYRELLQYSEELKKKGQDLFKTDESKYHELLSYSAILNTELMWESRDLYIELMGHFLDGEISIGELKGKFLKIQNSEKQVQRALESNLIILSPSLKADYVADLVEQLYWILEDSSLDSILSLNEIESLIKKDQYQKAEQTYKNKIYDSIEKIYLKMKKYLDKEV